MIQVRMKQAHVGLTCREMGEGVSGWIGVKRKKQD